MADELTLDGARHMLHLVFTHQKDAEHINPKYRAQYDRYLAQLRDPKTGHAIAGDDPVLRKEVGAAPGPKGKPRLTLGQQVAQVPGMLYKGAKEQVKDVGEFMRTAGPVAMALPIPGAGPGLGRLGVDEAMRRFRAQTPEQRKRFLRGGATVGGTLLAGGVGGKLAGVGAKGLLGKMAQTGTEMAAFQAPQTGLRVAQGEETLPQAAQEMAITTVLGLVAPPIGRLPSVVGRGGRAIVERFPESVPGRVAAAIGQPIVNRLPKIEGAAQVPVKPVPEGYVPKTGPSIREETAQIKAMPVPSTKKVARLPLPPIPRPVRRGPLRTAREIVAAPPKPPVSSRLQTAVEKARSKAPDNLLERMRARKSPAPVVEEEVATQAAPAETPVPEAAPGVSEPPKPEAPSEPPAPVGPAPHEMKFKDYAAKREAELMKAKKRFDYFDVGTEHLTAIAKAYKNDPASVPKEVLDQYGKEVVEEAIGQLEATPIVESKREIGEPPVPPAAPPESTETAAPKVGPKRPATPGAASGVAPAEMQEFLRKLQEAYTSRTVHPDTQPGALVAVADLYRHPNFHGMTREEFARMLYEVDKSAEPGGGLQLHTGRGTEAKSRIFPVDIKEALPSGRIRELRKNYYGISLRPEAEPVVGGKPGGAEAKTSTPPPERPIVGPKGRLSGGKPGGKERGAIGDAALGSAGGGIIGAGIGAASTSDPEERRRRLLLGFLLGAGAGYAAGYAPEAIAAIRKVPASKLIGEAPEIRPPNLPPATDKLTELIKESRPVRAQTEALRRTELGRRIGRSEAVRTSGEPVTPELYAKSRGELAGKLPHETFESVREKLTPDEINQLVQHIDTFPGVKHLERLNAEQAIDRLIDGAPPRPFEYALLEKMFGSQLVRVAKQRVTESLGKRALTGAQELQGLMRAINVTGNLHGVLRQGLITSATNPGAAWRAFKAQLGAFAREDVAQAVDESIRTSKWAQVKNLAGLELPPIRGGTRLLEGEEMVATSLTDRLAHSTSLPVRTAFKPVRASERAYVTMLNKLRSDAFDDYANKWHEAGITYQKNPKLYEDLAKMLNLETGRGKLPGGKEIHALLNAVLFAPRYLASRFELPAMVLDPRVHPEIRKMVARRMVTAASMVMGGLALAKATGFADVETDPRSSDFLKMRVGKVRVDLGAGYLPILRLIMSVSGQRKTQEGEIKPADRGMAASTFVRGKLSPMAALAWEAWTGKDYSGRPQSIPQAVATKFMPFFLHDLAEAWRAEGAMGLMTGVPGFFGAGVHTYRSKDDEQPASPGLP